MSRIDNNAFFADFNSLAELKVQSQKDPDAALKQVAQQFEAIFINMMFKNMRDSNENIGGGLFDSTQTKQYTEMMDSQMAQSLASAGGIGLADSLIKQFQGKGKTSESTDDASVSDAELMRKISALDTGQVQTAARTAAQLLSASPVINSTNQSTSTASLEEATFDTPENFVDQLWPHAKEAGAKLGVDPKAILAQAALETGWGKHAIAKDDGTPSFNLFGIKADHRWSGDRAVVNTLEYRNGIAQKERASFRAYDSFSQSFDDYADFIQTSDRYKNALSAGDDAAMFAAYLQKGGYATDPDYASKITDIMTSKWFRVLI